MNIAKKLIHPRFRTFVVMLGLAVLAGSPTSSRAINFTWDGGAGDGLWQDTLSVANWVGDAYAPGNAANNGYIFTSSGYVGTNTITLTNGHNPNITNFTINANAPDLTFNIDGTTATTRFDLAPAVSGAETITVLGGSHSINRTGGASTTSDNGRIQLQAFDSQIWNIASGATLTINASVNGSSASRGFTKIGGGMLVLANTSGNPFTGKVSITNGTVAFVTPGALGAAPAAFAADQISVNGAILQALSPNSATWSTNRGLTIGANGATIDVPSSSVTLTIGSQVAGSGSLTKSGAGGLTLSAANTYTGKTIVTGGTISIDTVTSWGALPGSAVADQVTLNGCTMRVTDAITSAANRGFKIDSNGVTIQVSGSSVFTIDGPISGVGSLTNTSSGNTFELGSTANTYGDTYMVSGFFRLDDNAKPGTGTLHLMGGAFTCGADRSSTANYITNALEIAADSVLRSNGGNDNSSRNIVFSGNTILSTAGTLTITNGAAATNNTFFVRLHGAGFNLSRPLVLNNGATANTNLTYLTLANSNATSQTFSGVISGNGRVRRTALGAADAGTSIFTGANTYSGPTEINAGTLLVNNATGSGTGSGAVTVTATGVLGGTGSAGSTTVSSAGTISPGVTVGNLSVSNLTLGATGNYLWQIGAVSGTPGTAWDLITVGGGAGTVTQTATSGSPFILKLDSMGVSPTGWNKDSAYEWEIITAGAFSGFDASGITLNTDGFAGEIAGVFTVSLVGNSLHLFYMPAADLIIDVPAGTQTQGEAGYPVLSQTGGLVKTGAGELRLTNSANSFLGTPTVTAGTLSVSVNAPSGAAGALGNSTATVLIGDTTGAASAALNIDVPGVTVSRGLDVQSGNSGAKTIGGSITSGTATYGGLVSLDDNVTFTAATGGTVAFGNVISGNGGITKTGAGIVSLSAQNTFAGTLRLNEGVLAIDQVNRLGALPASPDAEHVIFNGGTLRITGGSTSSGANRGYKFDTAGGAFDISSGVTFDVLAAFTGPGSVTNAGPGALLLESAASTYSGDTWLNAGTIQIDADSNLGSGTMRWNGGTLGVTADRGTTTAYLPNPISMTGDTLLRSVGTGATGTRSLVFSSDSVTASGGTLTVSNAASVSANTFNVRFHGAGFTFARPIVIDNGAISGNIGQIVFASSNGTAAQTFSGPISGNGRLLRGAITTGNGGTTILSGSNTYTGGTTVTGGKLFVNNPTGSGTGSGAVTVNADGTLGGTGAIVGSVAITGTVIPGASVGMLATGPLTLNGGGTNIFEVIQADGIAGLGHDNLNVTGGVNVQATTGSKFNLKLVSLNGAGTAGSVTNFNNNLSYVWPVATTTDSVTNFAADKFRIDTSSFSNDLAGGEFLVETGSLNLRFTNNHPPVVALHTVQRGAGTSVKIKLADLKALRWSDPDADDTSFSSIVASSTNGLNNVTQNGTYIFYSPGTNGNVTDRISYSIRDLRSAYRAGDTVRTSTGIIEVQVVPTVSTNSTVSLQVGVPGPNTNTLSFAGIPGYEYVVQFTPNLVDWEDLSTNTAGANGLWTVVDDTATNAMRFYRSQAR